MDLSINMKTLIVQIVREKKEFIKEVNIHMIALYSILIH